MADQLIIKPEVKELIKYQLHSNAARYYFFITLGGLISGVLLLTATSQGRFEVLFWAQALIFLGLTLTLGLTAWRWSMNRIAKKEALAKVRTYSTGTLTAEIIQESLSVPNVKRANITSLIKILPLVLGLSYVFFGTFELYNISTGTVSADMVPQAVMDAILGTSLVAVSLFINSLDFFLNRNLRKTISAPEPDDTSNSDADNGSDIPVTTTE